MTVMPFRDMSLFDSQGINANRHKHFEVKMEGGDWYELLQLLEHSAESSQHFPEIAQLTGLVIKIRTSLKDNGF